MSASKIYRGGNVLLHQKQSGEGGNVRDSLVVGTLIEIKYTCAILLEHVIILFSI